MKTAELCLLAFVAAAAVLTVVKGTFGSWFARPGEPPQRVVVVSPAGPTLWQRTAGFIVGALFVAVPAVLLLRYLGQHHDPATNYYAPTITSTAFPAATSGATPLPPTGGGR